MEFYLGSIIFYINFKLFSIEEFVVLCLCYNFFKLLLVCIVNELIWPTQFFNRRHNIGFQVIRYRTYVEVITKLFNKNLLSRIFLKINYKINFLNYMFK